MDGDYLEFSSSKKLGDRYGLPCKKIETQKNFTELIRMYNLIKERSEVDRDLILFIYLILKKICMDKYMTNYNYFMNEFFRTVIEASYEEIINDVLGVLSADERQLKLQNVLLGNLAVLGEARGHVSVLPDTSINCILILFIGVNVDEFENYIKISNDRRASMHLEHCLVLFKTVSFIIQSKYQPVGTHVRLIDLNQPLRSKFKSVINILIKYTNLRKELIFLYWELLEIGYLSGNITLSEIKSEIINRIGIFEEDEADKISSRVLYMAIDTKSNINDAVEILDMIFKLNMHKLIEILREILCRRRDTGLTICIIRAFDDMVTRSSKKNILVFLGFLSNLDCIAPFFEEVSSIFMNYIGRIGNEKCIGFYAEFLLRNMGNIPIHFFLRDRSHQFIIRFYGDFFRKLKYYHKLPDDSINGPIYDKHIIEFLIFFLNRKESNLVLILDMLPYIPNKRKVFYLIYSVWIFLFKKDKWKSLEFFALKTPALVKIADSTMISNCVPNISIPGLDSSVPNQTLYCIILITEQRKIENYDTTGVLNYICDDKTVGAFKEQFEPLFTAIHAGFPNDNPEFLLQYVFDLLNLLLTEKSLASSFKAVVIILDILVGITSLFIYDFEFHKLIRRVCIRMKSSMIQFTDIKKTEEMWIALYHKILKMMKRNAPYVHRYILLTLTEIPLFKEKIFDDCEGVTFQDFYLEYTEIMGMINTFPKMAFFVSEYDEVEPDKKEGITLETYIALDHPGFQNECPRWLIDVAYFRSRNASAIDFVTYWLKRQLEYNFNYLSLYILLRIHDKLPAFDQEYVNMQLHKVFHLSLNFKQPPSVLYLLALEAEGVYSYYFRSIYRILTAHVTEDDSFCFPNTINTYSFLRIKDLVALNNSFKLKAVRMILTDKRILSIYEYFFYYPLLRLRDVVFILMNCKRKREYARLFLSLIDKICTEECRFMIPQLVQCYASTELDVEIGGRLMNYAKLSGHFFIDLFFCLRSNLYKNLEGEKTEQHKKYQKLLNLLQLEDRKFMSKCSKEIEFIDFLVKVSKELLETKKKTEKTDSKKLLSALLEERINGISIGGECYLPFDRGYRIFKYIGGSAMIMQSHAKVPFMASFYVINEEIEKCLKVLDKVASSKFNPDLENVNLNKLLKDRRIYRVEHNQSGPMNDSLYEIRTVIVKYGDDMRQDMIALQLIRLFKTIFEETNVGVYIETYRVIATDTWAGIVEVVPNAKSRDQMGREEINNLKSYFEYHFGFRESATYLNALDNFVRSMAGYSLVVYFLNIKDRHNGNILIDSTGKMIHIDFGYMFDISPGNLNIEAPLKITPEIIELFGGEKSEAFSLYQTLVLKGFHALRLKSLEIIEIVDSYKNMGLECYKKDTMKNWNKRFRFDLNDQEVNGFVISLIHSATRRIRTYLYDKYQNYTNQISF